MMYRRADIDAVFEEERFCWVEIGGRQTYTSGRRSISEALFKLFRSQLITWCTGSLNWEEGSSGRLGWRGKQKPDDEGCQSCAESRLLPVSNGEILKESWKNAARFALLKCEKWIGS